MPPPWPVGRHRRHSPCRVGRSRSPAWPAALWEGPALPRPGRGNCELIAAPSRRGRRLCRPRVERCRGARAPPFTLELRVHPRPEPSLFLAPLQPLGLQDLAHPAALHADALLAQVGHQAVQGPRRERQAQLGGPRQRRSDNRAALLGGVGRRPPRAHLLLQPREAALGEALEQKAHRGARQAHPRRAAPRAPAPPPPGPPPPTAPVWFVPPPAPPAPRPQLL